LVSKVEHLEELSTALHPVLERKEWPKVMFDVEAACVHQSLEGLRVGNLRS
jgi:hypothetical protein